MDSGIKSGWMREPRAAAAAAHCGGGNPMTASAEELVSAAPTINITPILSSSPQAAMDQTEPDVEVEDQRHRPPMSVIVLSSPAAPDLQLGSPPSLSSRRESTRVTSSSSVFSTPFRLQPRSTTLLAAPGRDGAIRGRKRSAHSMSASKAGRDALLTAKEPPQQLLNKPPMPLELDSHSKPSLPVMPVAAAVATAVTPKRPPPCGSTPPRDTRRGLGRVDYTVVNFQCLSLQSPKRKDPSNSNSPPKHFPSPPQSLAHPPRSLSSSSSGTANQRPAMVPGSAGSSFQSPAASRSGTATGAGIQPRSSFNAYNAASPGGSISMRSYGSASIGSNARMNASARTAVQSPSIPSTCGGSAKSSPKIAPLTVLQDRGAKMPGQNTGSRLPPLPGGCMNSLWLSLESSQSGSGGEDNSPRDEQAKMLPPRTVHCRKPSSDSISTVQMSVLSPLTRPSPRRSPGGFSLSLASPASAHCPPKASTPRSKQRRLDEYTSPSQRTPRTPRTPLPRVTLTPRSTGSRRSRQSGMGLPRFPSPSDVDMDVTSPFLNSASLVSLRGAALPTPPRRDQAAIHSRFPPSSNSLALSLDGSANEGGSSTGRKKAPLPMLDFSPESSPVTRDLSGGSFMGVQTMSLLNSSRTGGILQAMMEEANGGMHGEMGSVSDIDEDEGFILASPGAIEEERFASCQPARQRRRRSCDRFANQATAARGSPPPSPNASNTNLAGMNYVTSSTSLFGMDIAHPTDSTSAAHVESRTQKTACETNETKRSNMPARSLDLGLLPNGSQTMKRRKSDASFDSIGLALDGTSSPDGGRDLVTPPPIPNPKTPPPLSPKEGFFMPVVMPEGTVAHNFARRDASSVCVAGADRTSVTMAIARMASEAHGHLESSPVL